MCGTTRLMRCLGRGEFDSLSPEALRMRASRELADHEGIQQCTDWLKTSRVKGDTSVLDGVKADGENRQRARNRRWGVYSKSDALATVNELIVRGGLTDKEKLAAIDLLNKFAAVEQGRDERG
jgi:predicted alpha-1,6-mannanase (GH76 family)